MRRAFVVSAFLLASAVLAVAQTSSIIHNTWTTGAAIPTPIWQPAGVGVLQGQIYIVGGWLTGDRQLTAETQIYNPLTNTWSTGLSLPTATADAASAVVNNVLYVIGGYTNSVTNAVWAYSPKTNTWTSKTPMPTARYATQAVVENNIIYVIGGLQSQALTTVESYNPSTDTWTEEAPLLFAKFDFSPGLIKTIVGSTIVVADGAEVGVVTGDNEGYNAGANTWTSLTADPTPRTGTCSGAIGLQLHAIGGYGGSGAALVVNGSFKLTKNKWTTTLASMPQGTMFGGSAVYKGQLYCFGGTDTFQGNVLNSVQIYQP